MNIYKADVTILPKDGVLDIQGKAVEKTLKANGFDELQDVRVGKFIRLHLEAADEDDAASKVRAISEDLLVNDLIESYSFTLEQQQ